MAEESYAEEIINNKIEHLNKRLEVSNDFLKSLAKDVESETAYNLQIMNRLQALKKWKAERGVLCD